jgi:hypothetical protein
MKTLNAAEEALTNKLEEELDENDLQLLGIICQRTFEKFNSVNEQGLQRRIYDLVRREAELLWRFCLTSST